MKVFRTITLSRLPAEGMAIFPFILLRKEEYKRNRVLINHERIHLQQQLELLIIPFYLLYLINYLYNLVLYREHHKAYLNIVFEREAYKKEGDLQYLRKRRFFAWFTC